MVAIELLRKSLQEGMKGTNTHNANTIYRSVHARVTDIAGLVNVFILRWTCIVRKSIVGNIISRRDIISYFRTSVIPFMWPVCTLQICAQRILNYIAGKKIPLR